MSAAKGIPQPKNAGPPRPAAGGFRGGGPGPGGHMAMMPGGKARNFKATMITLAKYLKPYRLSLLVSLVLAIVGTAFTIIGPKLMGNVTTSIFEGAVAKIMHVPGAGIDFEYVGRIVLILLGLYLAAAMANYVMGYIMTGVSIKVTYDLRQKISQKIDRLPVKYFDKTTYGEVLSFVTNDVDLISNTLNQSLFQLIISITTIIGVLVMMLSISWLMTLVALLVIPLSMIVIRFVVKRSQIYFRQQQDNLGHINGHIEEMYTGHNVMQAFNGEDKAIEKFDGINEKLYHASWRAQFLSGIMMPVMMFVSNLGYVIVCILGGYLTIQRVIQVGDILAFIQYVRAFTQPLGQVATMVNILQSTAAAAERIFEFLAEPEEIPDAADAVRLDQVNGDVSFRNVSFGYNPDTTVINNFSAEIKSGQNVAIVGATGAGKTTLIKLLMRFYDVNQGEIMVDGVDIRRMRRHDHRTAFGMVLQDAWLFNGSIKDNIRYGKLTASDDEVYAAAATAHIDHFINTLPGGYDMVLNEETTNISQGQKQLLTIARAVLANPKILILDEATSSVDTRTEILIQQAMERLMKDRTAFIIAHRLSTIRNADLILVMQDGEIVEQGNHQDLLARNGHYASLYNSQFETSAPETDA